VAADISASRARGSKLTEVTAAVIELLIEGEWLKPAEAADKRAIGAQGP
jgi:hypothetical protein